MSADRKLVAVFFALVGGALLVGLAIFAPWQVSVVLIAVLLLVLLAVRAIRGVRRRSHYPHPGRSGRYVPVMSRDRQARPIVRALLPSSEPDYQFLFSAKVLWRPFEDAVDESLVNPGALAAEAVVERARRLAEKRAPEDFSYVQHELSGVLGTMEPDETRTVLAMAESVELVLSAADRQRLEELATLRKTRALQEHLQQNEQFRQEYLSSTAFKDFPGLVRWQFARNDENLARTAQEIGLLVKLSAATGTEIPEHLHRFARVEFDENPADGPSRRFNGDGASAIDHLDAYLVAVDIPESDPLHELVIHQMAASFASNGRPKQAEDLRHRWPPESDPDRSAGTGHPMEEGAPHEGDDGDRGEAPPDVVE
ncbi:hypothetical protein [Rhizohabitans arisaemae]|uniref:hypothetical protein n=1 Tax=Rhizohabitans arisaemae TaxID=2720610 RepID=UPI0024B17116|nr:hypothetical protein [Rhizohabitans arisaemae]